MRQQKVKMKKSSFCTNFLSPGRLWSPLKYCTNLDTMTRGSSNFFFQKEIELEECCT